MTKDHAYLYLSSISEAKRQNEVALWRASHLENIACKQAIEESIRRGFDGMHLDRDCARSVIDNFGFKRVGWVLSATLQQKQYDGRFSPQNKAWAASTFIPPSDRNYEFTVESHPAVLDGFVSFYRKAVQALNLFGAEHCVGDRAEQDYTGKVLVLSPDTLKESCWSQENQLWYAHDGFGCSPHAIGRSVRCTCLSDGEMTRWNRNEFISVLDEKYLPDWAREKLEELMTQEQTDAPTMGGMNMK